MIKKLGTFILWIGCMLAMPGLVIGAFGSWIEGVSNDKEAAAAERAWRIDHPEAA